MKGYQKLAGTGTVEYYRTNAGGTDMIIQTISKTTSGWLNNFRFFATLTGHQAKWPALFPKLNAGSQVAFEGILVPNEDNSVWLKGKDEQPVHVVNLSNFHWLAEQRVDGTSDLLTYTVAGHIRNEPEEKGGESFRYLSLIIPIDVYMGKDIENRTLWMEAKAIFGAKKFLQSIKIKNGDKVLLRGSSFSTDEFGNPWEDEQKRWKPKYAFQAMEAIVLQDEYRSDGDDIPF